MKRCKRGLFGGVALFSVVFFFLVLCTVSYGEELIDTDGDGIVDSEDNCPLTYNPDQADTEMSDAGSYWKFDEESGSTANDSTGLNNGTITEATWTTGKAGNALSFNSSWSSSSYVSVPDINFPSGNSARTIETWFKTSVVFRPQIMFFYGLLGDGDSTFIFVGDTGELRIGNPGGGSNEKRGTTVVNDGQWHHVAFVYDGAGHVKLYVDSVLDTLDSDTRTYNTTLSGSATISAPFPGWGFNGLLDEVAIYGRAINVSEVQRHYQKGLHGRGYEGDGVGDACDNDQDNDGYPSPQDCDDNNASVNPGATEVVNNGVDDDCNPNTPVISVSGNAYNYPIPFFRASLSLNVNASSLGTGYLRYYYTRTRLNFVSSSITGISAVGGVAMVTGTGTVNGTAGYTFTAVITDGTTDAIGLEIKKPDGTLYYNTPSLPVASGNYAIVGQ